MTIDVTAFSALLKQRYTPTEVADLSYKKNPVYALLAKDESFGGESYRIPVKHADAQGLSPDFAIAQANALNTATKLKGFSLTHVKEYSVAEIDGALMRRSEGNENAFMAATKVAIDGAIQALTRRLSIWMYGSGWGTLGQIKSSSGISGNVITLSAAEDVANFEIGTVVCFSSAESTAVLRAGGSKYCTVTGRDPDAGTITVDAIVSTAANSDYIFAYGARQDSSSPTRQVISGFEAWLPTTAPSSGESFFGVDRSSDPQRLAGVRFSATGYPAEETLIEASSRVSRNGGTLTHFFTSYQFYRNLVKSLGARVQYIDQPVTQKVGFRGVKIVGADGDIDVIPDVNCRTNRVFGVDLDMWKLYSAGSPLRMIDEDGNVMLRQSNGDGYEVRFGFLGNLGCHAPGHNVICSV